MTSSRFNVEVNSQTLIITFLSDVSTEDSATIKELIQTKPSILRVLIDLSKVSLITTPGLGTLVSLSKTCRDLKRRLVLCGLSPYVNEIFDLTRLSPIFEILPSREAALSA
ncbi:MAG: STAS domain-containing protein [Candidatus Hydrogenedentota bacterium]